MNVPANLRLSGLVLFGNSELMVGLSDSQWLRIPLAAFPALVALPEDDRLDYRIEADATALGWPRQGLMLKLAEMSSEATSIEDGDEGPE